MKDTRQGNDIRISWSIFKKGGQIFSLEGKNISLYLKSVFGRKELNDFVVTGNIIQWTFYGKDQTNTGKYSLILVVNEGEKGMITTDKCDFVNLVSCSCKLQGGEDAPNVETESIELTSTLEYVSGGGDYDDTALWRALDGKVDKEEGLGLSEENYTTEDKEKLEGLENYDDSGIKEDLAKKAYKSEIPTKMSQLEQDIEIGSGYDDTEIKQEIAELSEGIALRNVGAEDTDESVDEPEIGGGGASTDKQGVIRQTQTWTQAADKGYDYVMQDIVRGSIPSHFIDLWKSRGGNTAAFNEATGYFEYEYLKDISYEEALFAYSIAVPTFESYQFANFDKGRFTLPQVTNGGANGQIGLNTTFTRCSLFECISLKDLDENENSIVSMSTTFFGCVKLKEIVGVMIPKNVTTLGDAIFNNCYSLEEVRLKQIKASIGFAASSRLSKDSVLYMIQNAQASPDITIKLHSDVYDRLEGDAEIQSALEAHPNVSLASA